MNPLLKNFILVVFILLLIGAIFSFLYYPSSPVNQISLTQLVADINQNKIKKIITNGDSLSITYIDETGAESKITCKKLKLTYSRLKKICGRGSLQF